MKKHHVLLIVFLSFWGATQASAVMWSQSTGAQVAFPLAQLNDPYSGPTGAFIPFAEVILSNPGKEVLDGNSSLTTNAGQATFSDRLYVYSQTGTLLLDPGWLTVSMNVTPQSPPQVYTGAGIATEATHPSGLLVHSVALSSYDGVTGTQISTMVVEVRDPVSNTPLWSKTFQNVPKYGELSLEMCHVTDANADGTDDIIVAFTKFNQNGTTTMTYGVLNILTGAIQSSTKFTNSTPQTTYYLDADSDTFGNPAVSLTSPTQPTGYVQDNTDCNDSNAAINPNAIEVIDGIDNNCDGLIDNVPLTYYQDLDQDSFGNPGVSMTSPTQPIGYVLDGSDCDDTNPTTYPGAMEIIGDGIDNNCDGIIL